ncbi:MAG: RHS repeat-associated core domain-containing protein [Bacteroidales bacterium]|nr:RHS repeat-associated core domain-containing protein [Bacteroidales bacterium]
MGLTDAVATGVSSASLYFGVADRLTVTDACGGATAVREGADTGPFAGQPDIPYASGQFAALGYDADGRTVRDASRGVSSIYYNPLGLPSLVAFSDGSVIAQTYDAAGTLLERHVLETFLAPYGQEVTRSWTTRRAGPFEFEGSSLKRVHTPTGYLSGGSAHHFVRDHQGSVRQVVAVYASGSAAVVQETHYYPYGLPFGESAALALAWRNGTEESPWRFGSKELLSAASLHAYDFGPRLYSPALCRFMTQDPKAPAYPFQSPYGYCLANPIRNVDPNGMDVAVLLKGNGLHLGLLIQNEDREWEYFSINGDNKYSSGTFSGGRPWDDLEVTGKWNSPQEFLDSEYNRSEGPTPNGNSSVDYYNYKEAFVIPTTLEQDILIKRKFIEISENTQYNLLNNNCATSILESLEAGGIKTPNYKVPVFSLGFLGLWRLDEKLNVVPFMAFVNLIKLNPYGQYIKQTKTIK